MNIEQRSATITASNLDERTLTARAVPYNEATCLHENVWERFEPDALEESPLGIKLRFEHDTTIGTVVGSSPTAGAFLYHPLAAQAPTGLCPALQPL